MLDLFSRKVALPRYSILGTSSMSTSSEPDEYTLYVAAPRENGQRISQEAPRIRDRLLPLTDHVVCRPIVGLDVAIPNGGLVPKF